ncbi:ABC-type Fe3+-hydroxamate transport system, periplasmic component [Nitzschia inconspicua]|uniref:ABC-type Fe3+-hydroxamate transport system, periplasmic component n=1 Tax=Nitzschia inconspicua TaxID=303405 RepID=A0A9K3QA45_9STRA|nr:ABC-type Fe3+-hydroxamate transport system, periplasmic component [Nitzschia inconspicua]
MKFSSSSSTSVLFLLSGTVLPGQCQRDGDLFPVTITNCNVTSVIKGPPQRAVTLNQGTTEIMLALGLVDHMVGTAYLDDEIWPLYKEDYDKVPVLSDTYPDIESLMSVNPDFLYGSYSSAFSNSSIDYHSIFGEDCELVLEGRGGHNAYCRPELHDYGIQTYLQTAFCELVEHRPENLSVEGGLFAELADIGNIFNVPDRAAALQADIEDHFAKALQVSRPAVTDDPDAAIKVLWLDSWDESEPYVGACCGSPQIIMEHTGAKNIFGNLGTEERRSWEFVPWEDIVAADPDVIVLVDASWDPADEKILNLCKHPTARQLRAVRNRAYISVPFSGSTLGVKIGTLAYILAEAMVALAHSRPLPSLDFSPITISYDAKNNFVDAKSGSQAITLSGVKVYITLPTFDSTNLEETCAVDAPQIIIADSQDKEQNTIEDSGDDVNSEHEVDSNPESADNEHSASTTDTTGPEENSSGGCGRKLGWTMLLFTFHCIFSEKLVVLFS